MGILDYFFQKAVAFREIAGWSFGPLQTPCPSHHLPSCSVVSSPWTRYGHMTPLVLNWRPKVLCQPLSAWSLQIASGSMQILYATCVGQEPFMVCFNLCSDRVGVGCSSCASERQSLLQHLRGPVVLLCKARSWWPFDSGLVRNVIPTTQWRLADEVLQEYFGFEGFAPAFSGLKLFNFGTGCLTQRVLRLILKTEATLYGVMFIVQMLCTCRILRRPGPWKAQFWSLEQSIWYKTHMAKQNCWRAETSHEFQFNLK